MMPERWQQIDRIYFLAFNREASQRTAFLEEACLGDKALQAEIESLLAHAEPAEQFMEVPGVSVVKRAMVAERAASMVGRRLGAYQIISLLGAGGMGEVYRAKDVRLGRTVALKILPAYVSGNLNPHERFEREARAISSLSHPHICPLYDVGRQDGIAYLVMEYLEGVTLASRLKKGPLPRGQILQYAIQITDALDSAHRQGVIHRDLKPGNIMLTKSGVKLLDFGLAKVRSEERAFGVASDTAALTAAGTILGTLPYIAPEQLNGGETDACTDIFALGAVVYEMATGEKAFVGESRASLIAAVLERETPIITASKAGAPAGLDHVVGNCLRKQPNERWQSAHDILLELKWIEEADKHPESTTATAATKSRKRAYVYWTLALTSMAATFLLGAALQLRYWEPQPSPIISEIAPPANTHFILEGSPALSPDGRSLAFPAPMLGERPCSGFALWTHLPLNH